MFTRFLKDVFGLLGLGGANGGIIIQNPDGNVAHQVLLANDGTYATMASGGGNLALALFNTASTSIKFYINGNSFVGTSSVGVTDFFYATTTGVDIQRGSQYAWGGTGNAYTGVDTGLARVTAAVVQPTNGSSGAGWFQNSAGCKVLNANATNATAVLANTNIAFTLIAGRSYSIKAKLSGGNSTAAEGFQFSLTGDGTVTATTFDIEVVGTQGTVTLSGAARSTALGTPITYTTFTTTSDIYFTGYLKCGVAGVVTLQFAEGVTHTLGTATLNAGSWVEFQDCVAV